MDKKQWKDSLNDTNDGMIAHCMNKVTFDAKQWRSRLQCSSKCHYREFMWSSLITDCGKPKLVDDVVTGMKITKTSRHQYDLFQEVPWRVLWGWLCCIFVLSDHLQRWRKNLGKKTSVTPLSHLQLSFIPSTFELYRLISSTPRLGPPIEYLVLTSFSLNICNSFGLGNGHSPSVSGLLGYGLSDSHNYTKVTNHKKKQVFLSICALRCLFARCFQNCV